MRDALQRAWLHKGPLAWLLLPFSLLYALVSGLHRGIYAAGLARREKLPVPVIVVGNVVAGGAGKTPALIAIVDHLKARGLNAGVISRGYGRAGSSGLMEVAPDSHPGDVGDEPLLIKLRCDVPVFVAQTRAEAGRGLLTAHPEVQVLVSDDGLQHHALERDIEVCVFDDRGTGNGWLLPAGPLRESWPRRADIVLRPASLEQDIVGHDVRRILASYAVQADGTLRPLNDLTGGIHAVAGIANPEAFFRMLREKEVPLVRWSALPDHHDFERLKTDDDAVLLCTEKDAVKLWRIRPDAWAVPLLLEIAPSFWERLDRLLDAKLSSRHGSETAGIAGVPGDEGPAAL
jgi:tetraacyldisaccharide 4'-kinase